MLFSVVVALACITTAVGLVSSTADHFATISRRKLGYRLCVVVICVFSAFVSNLGLDTIISFLTSVTKTSPNGRALLWMQKALSFTTQ